jgi:hypothetical protein
MGRRRGRREICNLVICNLKTGRDLGFSYRRVKSGSELFLLSQGRGRRAFR